MLLFQPTVQRSVQIYRKRVHDNRGTRQRTDETHAERIETNTRRQPVERETRGVRVGRSDEVGGRGSRKPEKRFRVPFTQSPIRTNGSEIFH